MLLFLHHLFAEVFQEIVQRNGIYVYHYADHYIYIYIYVYTSAVESVIGQLLPHPTLSVERAMPSCHTKWPDRPPKKRGISGHLFKLWHVHLLNSDSLATFLPFNLLDDCLKPLLLQGFHPQA